jgi:RNA polymerase sigma-70 factor (ECF subfamily)
MERVRMLSGVASALPLPAQPALDGLRQAMTSPGPDPAPAGESRMEGLLHAVATLRDRAAFAELFRHFAPRLKAFMMKGGADGDTAEELAQEAMIQVWRRAESFDPARAAASTWIYTIARNKRIDRIRREKRPAMSEDEYTAALGGADDGDARGDKAAERSQAEARLARSLAELPEDQAAVVKMAFYEDKSHSAIAAELQLPLGTVKSRIRLALARLRGKIRDLEQ